MAQKGIVCKLGNDEKELLTADKKKYDETKLREVEKRAAHVLQRTASMRAKYADEMSQKIADTADKQEYFDLLFKFEMGDLVNLKGVNGNRLEVFLATQLGEKAKALGLSPSLDFSNPGKVLENILEAKQIARSFIEEIVKYSGYKKVKQASKTVQDILRSKGINNGKIRREILVDAIELGSVMAQKATRNIGRQGDRVLISQYENFVENLGSYGLSVDEIETIFQQATEISAVMDSVRIAANWAGLDLGEVEGIGYITRIFTPEARMWFDRLDKIKESPLNKGAKTVVGTDVNFEHFKSRTTYKYIPEDDLVVAYQLGIEVDELHKMMSDGTLVSYLNKNVDALLLENMVDLGTLSKLPMTTREIFEYTVHQHSDLPFKGMSDLFLTDPEEIAGYYVRNLQEAAGNSQMAKTIVREGLQNGWVVTDDVYFARPDEFKDFIELDAGTVKRFYKTYEGDRPLYINRIAHDVWRATLAMSEDPAVMGATGGLLQWWGRALYRASKVFAVGALLDTGYAFRVGLDSYRAMAAAGGNMMRIPEAMGDIMRMGLDGSLDILDNTRKVYKSLDGSDKLISKRELFQHFMRHRATDLIPGSPNMQAKGIDFARDLKDLIMKPAQTAKSVGYLINYVKAFGAESIPDAANMALRMLEGEQEALFSRINMLANFFELHNKWATVLTLADTRTTQKFGTFVSQLGATTKDYTNLRDIFRHVDDYFFNWQFTGQIPQYFNILRPFSVYAMKNPPSQLRHMLRRPRAFVNYWRIRSFISQPDEEDKDYIKDLNEGTVPDWLREGAPIFPVRDPDTGNWTFLLTSSWDATADAWNFFGDLAKKPYEMSGFYVGSTQRQRELMNADLKKNGRFHMFLEEMMANANPVWRNTLSVLVNKDLRTGIELDKSTVKENPSLFGMSVNPLIYYVATAYPPVDKINRSRLMDSVFGVPEIRDAKTNRIVIEGTPSVFGARRIAVKWDAYQPGQQKFMLNLLQSFGLNMKIVDVGKNLQWSFSDAKRNMEEYRTSARQSQERLFKMKAIGEDVKFKKEYDRLLIEHNRLVEGLAQAENDTLILGVMLQDRGIPPKEAFEDLEGNVMKMLTEGRGGAFLTPESRDYITKEQQKIVERYGNLYIPVERPRN